MTFFPSEAPFVVLKVEDGYTLRGETSGKGNTDGEEMPVVKFEYRPATGRDMASFRYSMASAISGDAQHDLRRAFIIAHVVSWDVVTADGAAAKIVARVIDLLPDPVLLDIVNECTRWKPRPQEEAAKN